MPLPEHFTMDIMINSIHENIEKSPEESGAERGNVFEFIKGGYALGDVEGVYFILVCHMYKKAPTLDKAKLIYTLFLASGDSSIMPLTIAGSKKAQDILKILNGDDDFELSTLFDSVLRESQDAIGTSVSSWEIMRGLRASTFSFSQQKMDYDRVAPGLNQLKQVGIDLQWITNGIGSYLDRGIKEGK